MERETEKKESMDEVVIPSIQVGFSIAVLTQSRKEKNYIIMSLLFRSVFQWVETMKRKQGKGRNPSIQVVFQ